MNSTDITFSQTLLSGERVWINMWVVSMSTGVTVIVIVITILLYHIGVLNVNVIVIVWVVCMSLQVSVTLSVWRPPARPMIVHSNSFVQTRKAQEIYIFLG